MISKDRNRQLKEFAKQRLAGHADPEARKLALKSLAGTATPAEKRRLDRLLKNPDVSGERVILFLDSEQEAERVRALVAEETGRRMALTVGKLNAEVKKLSRYPGIAQAMSSRYIMQLKRFTTISLNMRTLTELETEWLGLRITVAGYRKKDNAMIFLSAAEIARRMKLNRKYVNRMEDRLEKREDIKAVLREAGARPRLARGAACPKRP